MKVAPHSNPNKPVCNRFYSIASSGKVSPTSIAICGVVVEYKIPDGRSNYGVATTWLRWAEWSALKCFCLISSSGRSCLLGRARRGFAQRFPPMSGGHSSDCPTELRWGKTSPLLLSTLSPDTCDYDWAWNWVGSIQRVHPGLFVFHFRWICGYCENLYIQERAWQKENGKTVGPTVLFFGCRNKDQDYIYRLVEATNCRESCYFFLLSDCLVTSPLLLGKSWRLGSRMACSHSTLLSVETR